MKKSVKILIGIIAFVAITAALHFANDIVRGGDYDPDDPGTVSYYSHLSNVIDKSWKNQTQWNRQLYDSLDNEIRAAALTNNIKKKQSTELLNTNNISAVNTILKFYDSQMKSSGCSTQSIENNQKGIKLIKEFTDGGKQTFKDDKMVVQAETMYNAYKATMDFAGKTFTKTAKVNGMEWEPYSRNEFDTQRERLAGNQYFKSHFSKIDVVRKAWDSYESKVSKAEIEYYSSIASQLDKILESSYRECSAGKEKLDNGYNALTVRVNSMANAADAASEDKTLLMEDIKTYKGQMEDFQVSLDNSLNNWVKMQSSFAEDTRQVQHDYSDISDNFSGKILWAGYRTAEVKDMIKKTDEMYNKISAI